MKKILFVLIASLLLFASCADKASENSGDTPVENSAPGGERIAMYDKDGLSFDVPEAWQQNFKAVTREVGSTGNTYPQTDFYYTDGSRDIRLMTIGKFTREQWEKMKADGKVGDDSMLGESGDKKHVYSVFFEDHVYIEDSALRASLGKIRSEAENLRDKMMIN